MWKHLYHGSKQRNRSPSFFSNKHLRAWFKLMSLIIKEAMRIVNSFPHASRQARAITMPIMISPTDNLMTWRQKNISKKEFPILITHNNQNWQVINMIIFFIYFKIPQISYSLISNWIRLVMNQIKTSKSAAISLSIMLSINNIIYINIIINSIYYFDNVI